MTPVFSRCVACGVMIEFRASFVQTHRAVIQAESIQRFDGSPGLSGVCHFDEGETARSTGVSVRHESDRFNRPVGREKIFQLRFRSRRIQVSNEDVNHDFLQTSRPVLLLPFFALTPFALTTKSEKAISLDIASSQNSPV